MTGWPAALEVPLWLSEFEVGLSVYPTFVVTGAVNELQMQYLPTAQMPAGGVARAPGAVGVPVLEDCYRAVTRVLAQADYKVVLLWSYTTGLTCLYQRAGEPGDGWRGVFYSPEPGAGEAGHPQVESLAQALRVMANPAAVDGSVALLVLGAERLAQDPRHDPLRDLVTLGATQARVQRDPVDSRGPRGALFSPVVWLVERQEDLPAWFLSARGVRTLSVAAPDVTTRAHLSYAFVLPQMGGYADADAADLEVAARTVAELTHGMTQAQMEAVGRFAGERGLALERVDEAVTGVQTGLSRQPWSDASMRQKIVTAKQRIEQRLVGQSEAVSLALRVVARSVVGLTDWNQPARSARPRGVLFLAGPTGVGKTLLAKLLAQNLFGREDAMIRFDMSEYASEHSEARLIGAPPGYVGHDAGGQLTDAVRREPFSLLLFDELDKAHPRILDKFLQILEDGRLTDGTGRTVSFAETLIVFTSNLGVKEPAAGQPRPAGTRRWPGSDVMSLSGGELAAGALVAAGDPVDEPADPDDDPDLVRQKVRRRVNAHFTTIGRPEVLNRLGDNIIVFTYLSGDQVRTLMDRQVQVALAAVRERTDVTVTVEDDAAQLLREMAADRENRAFGGRRVEHLIESQIIDPLSYLIATTPGLRRARAVAGAGRVQMVTG